MWLPWTPIYMSNILGAAILKKKLFRINFLVLCVTVPDTYLALWAWWQNQVLGNIPVEGHTLGKSFPGAFNAGTSHQHRTWHSPARTKLDFLDLWTSFISLCSSCCSCVSSHWKHMLTTHGAFWEMMSLALGGARAQTFQGHIGLHWQEAKDCIRLLPLTKLLQLPSCLLLE